MSESPRTKADLMAQLTAGWQTLEDRLRTLSEAQLTARRTPNEWSIKDHLAHLMAYELGMAALLRREPRWAAMQLDAKFARDSESFDEINAVLYERHADRSAPEVLTDLRDAHQQLLQALTNLTDDDLLKPYAAYQPHDPEANEQDPVLGWIIGNTYEHYAEHLPWMEELLAQQPANLAGAPTKKTDTLIARVWRGRTLASQSDRYMAYMQATGVHDLRATDGNRGVYVFRRIDGDQAEFTFLSLWDSLEAIRRFAGEDVDRAVYYPEDRDYLLALDPKVIHHEVLAAEGV